MAKTFNPQRVGGGTFSLVRDSQGNYSLKETGFDKVVSLPMIELGQTAQTTTAKQTKTASQLTGQTAQALTSGATTGGGGGGGAFQFTDVSPYKLQQQGEDVSKRLTDIDSGRGGTSASALARQTANMGVSVDSGRGGTSASALARQRANEDTGALDLAEMDTTKTLDIKDTSETLDKPFKGTGTMTTSQRSKLTKGTRVGPGTIKSRMAAERDTDIGTMDTGTLGISSDRDTDIGTMKTSTLGIKPTVGSFGQDPTSLVGGTDLEADAGTEAQLGIKKAPTPIDQLKESGRQIKKTVDSILQPGAAIKVVGKMAGAVAGAIFGRKEDLSPTDQFKMDYFKTNFDLGSSRDPGRIVGNPQTNVFAGMNRNSAFGNLGQSGQNRVDRVAGYAAKNRAKAEAARKAGNIAKAKKYEEKAKRQEDKARTFQNQVNKYNSDKNTELEKKRKEKAQNPNLRAGADSGPGSGRDSGKSIVCTAMYQTTGLQDWSKAMKIWYIYQKKYLTLQHQEGYHKLFKPFVKGMHKSNIIKAIGAHFAKHRTQHLKHVMFNSKPSLLGKIYNKILEPICYWAGSK
jgi:hypothetical protein